MFQHTITCMLIVAVDDVNTNVNLAANNILNVSTHYYMYAYSCSR